MIKTIRIDVERIVFNTERNEPELILADGTKRVLQHMATGSCWVTYWVTPEERDNYEQDKRTEARLRAELANEVAEFEAENLRKNRGWWTRT